jgi:hypothetical protein
MSAETYLIHDNGGRPFKVLIEDLIATVYKRENDKYNTAILTFACQKIFVGISPLNSMTKFSGGYGKKFDGNSILLHLNENNYIYIGKEIYKFKSHGKIITYISPVGNNDVPYPYAIDEHDNYYLMIENVVIMRTTKTASQMVSYSDPYEYYYHYQKIDEHSELVNDFYIGKESSIMNYHPNPDWYYNWYSLPDSESDSESDESDNKSEPSKNNRLFIIDRENNRIELTREKYIEIIESYGELQCFKPINKVILQGRLF